MVYSLVFTVEYKSPLQYTFAITLLHDFFMNYMYYIYIGDLTSRKERTPSIVSLISNRRFPCVAVTHVTPLSHPDKVK